MCSLVAVGIVGAGKLSLIVVGYSLCFSHFYAILNKRIDYTVYNKRAREV